MTSQQPYLAIVTLSDLPGGAGNTLRLRRLVQAFLHAGVAVEIWNEHALGVAPPETLQVRGEIGGAPFDYVSGTVARGRGFGVIGEKLRAVASLRQLIKQRRREGRLDIVLFNNLSFYDTWPLTRLARSLGVKTIQAYEDERLELVSTGPRSLSRRVFGWNARLADTYCPRMADAIFAISHYLADKYRVLVDNPARVHLVPTIIDCDAWQAPPEIQTEFPTVLYAGAFGEQDEMENLIDAFGLLANRGVLYQAVFLGNNARAAERIDALKRQATMQSIEERIDWRGFVPNEAVRAAIGESAVLLNIRREGIWSRSGLSTKLSEFLASGRLVLASEVGEVPRYLKHGESALLVSAATGSDEIATALGRALASPEERKSIGAGGHAVAKRCFDLPVVSATLREHVVKLMQD